MNRKLSGALFFCSLGLSIAAHAQKDVSLWLTNADRSALFQRQSAPIPLGSAGPSSQHSASQQIDVDDKQTFQTMDGFGFALTGGSAQLIMHMDPAKRAALLGELFTDSGNGIGISYLRLSIGASDMNDHVFSYDDLPKGETDPGMAKFSLEPDRADVIPLMKQILAIHPKMKVLASPWSAPLWMKTNNAARGGVLKPEDYAAYAAYLVKYLQGMRAEGITIDTLTVQNEPLNEKNTPSMLMLDSEQDVFIRDNLGPALQSAGLATKIVLYDHNLDHPLYPLSILRDPKASKYIAGSGFHLYGGTVEAMTEVHDAFPKKNIYFTEQSITDNSGGPMMRLNRPVAEVIVGVSRNWSKNILLWNLAADPSFGPHTDEGGCPVCSGALTIDGDQVKRNLAYYTLAHASKLVQPGSVRIGSTDSKTVPNVAFRTPEGKRVLIVSNVSDAPQSFDVHNGSKVFTTTLQAGSVGTYQW